jgi:hypothetical protein
MRPKKTALGIIGLVLTVIIGVMAGRYYLDNIKLPELPPRQVVEQYFEALKNQEYKKAYDFVSLRHYNNTFNQFIDRVAMYSPQMRLEVTGESIDKDSAVVDTKVTVPLEFGSYSSNSNMDLVRVKREWKIIHP